MPHVEIVMCNVRCSTATCCVLCRCRVTSAWRRCGTVTRAPSCRKSRT